MAGKSAYKIKRDKRGCYHASATSKENLVTLADAKEILRDITGRLNVSADMDTIEEVAVKTTVEEKRCVVYFLEEKNSSGKKRSIVVAPMWIHDIDVVENYLHELAEKIF